MDRRTFRIAALAFSVATAAFWGAAAWRSPPGIASVHGEAQTQEIHLSSDEGSAFVWEARFEIADPRAIAVEAFVPWSQRAPREASSGADATIDLHVNGRSAYKLAYGGEVRITTVVLPRSPASDSTVDWSGLQAGSNNVRIYANFSTPESTTPPRGAVQVGAGPLYLYLNASDADRDFVADGGQPVPFLPTYVAAGGLGLVAAATTLAWTRVAERSRRR